MSVIFESTILKRSTRNLQMALAIPTGLMGGYLLINMIHAGFGKRLFMGEFFSSAIFLFFALIAAITGLWYFAKGKLTIYQVPQGKLEVEISFPSGENKSDKGKWTCHAIYTKTYAKYGMYYKNLALNIACDGRSLYLLRHQLGGLHAEPANFTLVGELYNLGGTEYWCKNVQRIEEIMRSTL